jgi:hypothetical protein
MANDKQLIEYSLYQTVKNNSVQKYPKLTRAAQPQLLKLINKNDGLKSKFLELVAKRDHYTKKLLILLSDLLPTEPELVSGQLLAYNGPDPKYITNRYHALEYVRLRIVPNKPKFNRIKTLIQSQLACQESWKSQRMAITTKYEAELEKLNSDKDKEALRGQVKLQGFNTRIIDEKIKTLTKEYHEKLQKFDESILFKCVQLSQESIDVLFDMNVPFFVINDNFKYPDLHQDQVFMLQKLQEMATNDKKEQS